MNAPAIARGEWFDHGQAPELIEVLGGLVVVDLQELGEDVLCEPVRDGGGFQSVAESAFVLGEHNVESY